MEQDFIALRKRTGMSRMDFCEWFGIPYRTVQDWELGNRQAPFYVFNLIKEKVEREFPNVKEHKLSVLEELHGYERRSHEGRTQGQSEPYIR